MIRRLAFLVLGLSMLAACSQPGSQLTVTSLTPADGATGVAVDIVLAAAFNVGIDADSVMGAFSLNGGGGNVAGAVAYDAATRTATFTPAAPLAFGTTYTAVVDGSVHTVRGATLAGDASWSFTTAAAPTPTASDAIGAIDVDPPSSLMGIGSTLQLELDFSGIVGNPDLSVTWTSSNDAIATVTDDGLVTGVAQGFAIIRVVSMFDPTVSASATVSVRAGQLGVGRLIPSKTSTLLIADANEGFSVSFDGLDDLAGSGLEWSTTDPCVAVVDENGVVTAVGPGSAVITARSTADGSVFTHFRVFVVPGRFDVEPDAAFVLEDASIDLMPVWDVDLIAYPFITWESSDEGIATVDQDGRVTGVGLGIVTITATAYFGDASISTTSTLHFVEELVANDLDLVNVVAGVSVLNEPIVVTGGLEPYAFTALDPLPAGLTLSADGVLQGTPDAAGSYEFDVRVDDASGQHDTITVTLEVVTELVASDLDLPDAVAGETVLNAPIVVTGGVEPYAFTALDPLPAGLTLSAAGVLQGTPSAAGSYTIRVRVSDASGQQVTITINLEVDEADDIGLVDRTLAACGVWSAATSGGPGTTIETWDITAIPAGASFSIRFNAYGIPDKFIVEYEGDVVLDTGWRGNSSHDGNPLYPGGIAGPGAGQEDDIFTRGASDTFTVTVIGPASGTAWVYDMRCDVP